MARVNGEMVIAIDGPSGSGKTTMLNALSKMIDPGERVLTIEDAAELLPGQENTVSIRIEPPSR